MPDTPISPSQTTKRSSPILVAHRGASERYPENTIVAYQAAVEAGAKFVELDVQFTRDHVPIVHHDVDLLRMTGEKGNVLEMTSAEVLKRRASYPKKFGDKFASNPLATLSEFSHWFSQFPKVTVFVEIKKQSIEALGTDKTARLVMDAIKPVLSHAVIISFHDGVLDATRRVDVNIPIGWVLPEYSAKTKKRAAQLAPEYLFCKTTRIPKNRVVWKGDWQWALYNTDTVADAMDFFQSGFEMLETNRIVDLLASAEFAEV